MIKHQVINLLEKKITLRQLALIIILSLCLLYLYMLYHPAILHPEDVSLTPTVQCKLEKPGNVWLISYADGEVHLANQRALTANSVNKCIDFILPYQRKDLDTEFSTRNAKLLAEKRGAGYWLWKPHLIEKTLQLVPENDVVIYMDSGAMPTKPLDALINQLGNNDILLFEAFHSMAPYTKRKALQLMGMDNEQVRNNIQLHGAFIIVRNTADAMNFVREWLKWCEVPRAIDDSPSEDEYLDFKEHRHDQAILSLVYYQHPERAKILPYETIKEHFWHHHRREVYHSLVGKD
jgi:hypothetical protein